MKIETARMPRVALIGNLVMVAFNWALVLRKLGIDLTLYVSEIEWERLLKSGRLTDHPDWVRVMYAANDWRGLATNHPINTLRRQISMIHTIGELENYDVILSFTASLFRWLHAAWRFGVLRRKPYIAVVTGSDLRERAYEQTMRGRIVQFFFRQAALNLLLNIDLLDWAKKLLLPHQQFFPFLIDTQVFSPKPVARPKELQNKILYFMPSHLDWGEEDNKAGRNSTKGNNRFLHAFAAVSSGQSEHLIMLDRGSDRKAAKELIRQLGIQEHVTLLAELNRDELAWYYRMADVVVDQFDIGAFGASALEAMACGKPCMIYINESYARECYGDLPPIANAHTAEEIEKQIHALRSEAKRSELGAAAREWILAHHEADRYGRVLVELIQQVTQRTDR